LLLCVRVFFPKIIDYSVEKKCLALARNLTIVQNNTKTASGPPGGSWFDGGGSGGAFCTVGCG
jgi:hypothetical protein